MDELHRVLHKLPDYLKAVALELLDRPMPRQEMQAYMEKLGRRMPRFGRKELPKVNLDNDIASAIENRVMEEKDGMLHLTPGGREIAEHMQEVIPYFMDTLFSLRIVSGITIAVHILLSILKLTFGLISGSAGLIADGVDNTVDTASSVLVWLGIRFNKEKLTSLFIIVMMFVSLVGIGLAAANKITNPGPLEEGIGALIVSGLAGLLMLALSTYQYIAGRRNSNFTIMCQSVDSRNHVFTSLLVCGGIVLSFFAERFNVFSLYYADAAASIVIGFLILKSAVELSIELTKSEGKEPRVSHFMGTAQERMRQNAVWRWLQDHLREGPLTRKELEARFKEEFCGEPPRILMLTRFGYRPQGTEDLERYLACYVQKKELLLKAERYMLPHHSGNDRDG
jgi:hypothetical protein